MTEQTYEEHEIPIYSVKGSQKCRDIQARFLFNLCETSITSQMVENVCNIVLFLIAADWFVTIIASIYNRYDFCTRSSTHCAKLFQRVMNI